MRTFEHIGIGIPQVYLPAKGVDLVKWAVVACDQYTSEPEYWQQVERIVGDSPSTLRLVLPEIYIGTAEEAERTRGVNIHMREYLEQGLLVPHEGIFYIERWFGSKCRRGILLCLDLEKYDFQRGSQSLIRATEGTIIERLPPRIKIRQQAILEIPHIIVLIDDPERTVIEPLGSLVGRETGQLYEHYDFDLMLDSGHLAGFQIIDPQVESEVVRALEALAEPEAFRKKYGLGEDQSVFLFAMGDGNHSLATAKSIWEKNKHTVGMDHPSRYALVEIENVHDDGLEFAPIHRVLFNLKKDVLTAMQEYFGPDFHFTPTSDLNVMIDTVECWCENDQAFGIISEQATGFIEIANPKSNLAVGTLQNFLDIFMQEGGAEKIDYVHGFEAVSRLGCQAGNIGFYLPCMDKNDLFKTVILDGALPRKTFSMGEAFEKRFYVECRKIVAD
jgi:Protein of unknown function (DUF1015)